MKALAGIRVIDFTQVLAGPTCTQYMGDLGAEVIKVEPVTGDDARHWPPFREGVGTSFLTANRNKRSLAIDLKAPSARDVIARLVKKADVVIESFADGVTKRLGIDFESLKAHNPQIIYCSISGYGRSGPLQSLRGYDLVLQAFTGIMAMTGPPGSGPTRIPLSPIDQGTGLHALSGILAALLNRGRTGEGAFLEVSLFETAVGFLGFNLERFWARGTLPAKSGSGHESLCPYQVFSASDGPILVGIPNNNLWTRFCKVAKREDLLSDPRFATNADRVSNFDVTVAVTQGILSTKTRQQWLDIFYEMGVPCSFVNTMEDLMKEPHTAARGIIMDYEHPELGASRAIAYPVQFNGEKRVVDRPPPGIGQHSKAILRELGYSENEIAQYRNNKTIAAS